MANTYFDLTGVLVLDKVTPVIEAVFGPYELDGKHPGNGEAYIANLAESSSCTWESIMDNLGELAEDVGVATTGPDGNEIETIGDMLKILAPHFNAVEDADLDRLIENDCFSLDETADLTSLFVIAKAFDDGHGLKAIKTEGGWHCDKPLLFQFGGCGDYVGLHFSTHIDSHTASSFGERVEQALGNGQHDIVAQMVGERIDILLSGIKNRDAREDVQVKLASILNSGDASSHSTNAPTANATTSPHLFMTELQGSVETLSAISDQYGSRTLADLMYLQHAIQTGGFIDHFPGESKVLDVVRALPSGEHWAQFIRSN